MASGKNIFGDGTEGIVLAQAFTTTAACVSSVVDHRNMDGCALQLLVSLQVDQVNVVSGTDNVVASTKVFTFGNYTFTGLVGATINISGAANAGNNGSFVISAVSGHTATCSTASGLVNETFGPAVVVTVSHSETAAKPAGTWTVAASNNYSAPSNGSAYGQTPATGNFSDVSALFNAPAVIAAVNGVASQYVQTPNYFGARAFQITFTPTGGLGTATAIVLTKSWSR